jgi:hypothetical protein
MMTQKNPVKFKRIGRSYHMQIETAADLANVLDLDEALWVATNAPLSTIHCDPTFLAHIDADQTGRITCREIKEAVRWLLDVLRDHSGISKPSRALILSAVNTESDEGKIIHKAAQKILARKGQAEPGVVSLHTVRKIKSDIQAQPVSEAGVVLPQAAEDPDVQQFIRDIIAVMGGILHPTGRAGIDAGKLELFGHESRQILKWLERGKLPHKRAKTDIMPFGEKTPQLYEILKTVRSKLDQYFAQCEALVLDEQFAKQMGWTETELADLDFDDPAVIEKVLQKAPLAKARSDRELWFEDDINPSYVKPLEQFREKVLTVLQPESTESLTALQWQEIKDVFTAHRQWLASKPDSKVSLLDEETLRTYQNELYAEAVYTLIDESTHTAFDLDNIRLLEKVILYQVGIIDLVNNFVSFPHLYDPQSRAMFEMGSLVMDGRRFNFAVKVQNRKEHVEVAKTSNMFVMYVEVVPKDQDTKYEVAIPVTSGGKGNLCLGKRGIFLDIHGHECDAKVVHIIENPISYREALFSPFQRLVRILTGKIESITTEAEKKWDKRTSQTLTQIEQQSQSSQAAEAKQSRLLAGGLLVGGGVALAALSSALAYIAKSLTGVPLWKILIGIGGSLLAVMLPITIVAFFKLRKRDLSAILEGSGWGINARMKLTHQQGWFFTEKPKHPPGSKELI